MTNWTDIIQAYRRCQKSSVLVTIGPISGSTPRESGARMLVTPQDTLGTIGGGQLEFMAISQARKILESAESQKAEVLKLPLGPELAQCCGGRVEILLTPLRSDDEIWMTSLTKAQGLPDSVLLTSWKSGKASRTVISDTKNVRTIDPLLLDGIRDVARSQAPVIIRSPHSSDNFTLIEPTNEALFHLSLFGAGHVGKAVVNTLSQLPCTISWIDERDNMFPDELPDNVKKIVAASPIHQVIEAPDTSFYLVMTHSHQLDLDLCAEILKRGDVAYLGLIGSKTKRQKFLKRLTLRGFNERQLSNLTCPIGLENLKGKHPAQIAISVSAEILERLQAQQQMERDRENDEISLHN